MPHYIVRIQLDSEPDHDSASYRALHGVMERAGFRIYLIDDQNDFFHLPTALYSGRFRYQTSQEMCDATTALLDPRIIDYQILVMKTDEMVGRLRKKDQFQSISTTRRFKPMKRLPRPPQP